MQGERCLRATKILTSCYLRPDVKRLFIASQKVTLTVAAFRVATTVFAEVREAWYATPTVRAQEEGSTRGRPLAIFRVRVARKAKTH